LKAKKTKTPVSAVGIPLWLTVKIKRHAVAFFLNRCSMQVAFFFFLINPSTPLRRSKKNQGKKDYIPFLPGSFNGLLYYCGINIISLLLSSMRFTYNDDVFLPYSNEYLIKCKAERVINAEFTVAQKLNQGTLPKRGCNPFRGPFFCYFFWASKKSKPFAEGIDKTTTMRLKSKNFRNGKQKEKQPPYGVIKTTTSH
jgi:hypothetical protein